MKHLILIITFTFIAQQLIAQCPDGYVTDKQNLVFNGNFSNGNQGFTSDYQWARERSFSGGPMLEEGYYSIVSNPAYVHYHFAKCYDHSKLGTMMVVNGSKKLDEIVWKQTIQVKKQTTYFFSCWIASALSTSPAQLKFSINNKNLGTPILASSKTCDWKQFFITWESEDDTEISISLVNQNSALDGNDFILDDITFYECTTPNFDVQLEKAKVGEVIELRKIFFETAKSELKDESFNQLNLLADYLKRNKNIEIEIVGHTDNVGNDDTNLKLSYDRANSVSIYLQNKGIEKARLNIVGYGETQPIDSNETLEGRLLNRRVEFKIIKM